MTRLMSKISFGWCPRVRSAARQLAKMPGCESIRVPSRSRRTEQGGAMLQHSDRRQASKWSTDAKSAMGLLSRASPVHTATRNCTGNEGGPFGFGDQVADPKPPRAAVVKSHGGERCGNAGTMIPAGTVERGERKRTVSEVSKAD